MSNTNKKSYQDLSPTQIFDQFGGELLRGNVSKVIRSLHQEGYTTSQISKMLGKRYQHVRNVLTEPVKK